MMSFKKIFMMINKIKLMMINIKKMNNKINKILKKNNNYNKIVKNIKAVYSQVILIKQANNRLNCH